MNKKLIDEYIEKCEDNTIEKDIFTKIKEIEDDERNEIEPKKINDEYTLIIDI